MIRIALLMLLAVLSVPAQTAGPGRMLSFDGTTADYVMVSPFNSFPSTAITVEFWMRASDTTKAGTAFSYAVSGEDNMLFIHDYRDLRFRLDGTAVPPSGGTGVAVNNGQWRHVAVTWTRTGGSFFLYVDGNLRYTASGVRTDLILPSGGAMVIGQDQDSVGGGFQAADAFLGTIDEFRIWNIALSPFSIRNDMHRSLTGTQSGLVLYYRMDETSGNLVDASGDGHTGGLSGATRTTSTAPVGLPVTVNTFAVSTVGTTTARMRGNVDPNGLSAIGFFEYGTNQLTFETARQGIASTAGATAIDLTQGGLRPSTTYFFRAVGSNALGRISASTLSFSTEGAPSVTTDPATTITSDSATLNATVNPRSAATIAWFQYGLTTNYSFTTASASVGPGTSGISVSAPIAGLSFDVTYNYRCVASNSYGISYGPNRTFVTQVFGDIGAGITGLMQADAAWGDYDNDGDLDLVIAGSTTGGFVEGLTQLLRNDNDGAFVPVSAGFPATMLGSVRWGDFDNDGWLDLLIMGTTPGGTNISEIRRNNGNGTFSSLNAGLPGYSRGTGDWGDYDNDGDLDLLLTGSTNTGIMVTSPARILRNNGNHTFTDINAGLRALHDSAAAWGDYDNDGDLDFAISGWSSGNNAAFAQVYRNNGNGTFTDINAGLIGMDRGSVSWADFDNDGDLDLLITGSTNQVPMGASTHLWRNLGNGSFSQVSHSLPRLLYSAAAWGDFDNDGDLDLALGGMQTNNSRLTELHRNNGNGTFSKLNASLHPVAYAALAWGDFDNDADLDLALLGESEGQRISHIRRNDSFPANTLPGAPTGLASSATISNVVLSWNPASDAQTPANALTYNIHVMPAVRDAQSDPASGYRRVPAFGNVQHGTNAALVLSNLPAGTYHWTVQAIDTALAGGPFAPPETIELPGRPHIIPLPAMNIASDSATLQALVNPGGRNTSASFDFGATTAYGTQLGATNIGNGYSNVLIVAEIGGLSPDTVYHFRATALNVFGPTAGADVSFRTHFFHAQPPSLAIALAPGAATNVSITLSNHIALAVNVTNRFVAPVPPYILIVNPTFALPANGTANVNLLIDSTGLVPDTYVATLEIVSGSTHAVVQVPIQLTVIAAEPADITSISVQPGGSTLLDFIATSGYAQTVFASTNLVDWIAIGPAMQVSPGRFQFTDPAATNFSQRFYKIRTQ